MPIFEQIELFLDHTYSLDERKVFIFRSRCICNYLERKLRELKFDTTLSRVNIICTKDEKEVGILKLKVQFLEVRIMYDLMSFFGFSDNMQQQSYIHVLGLGLKAAEKFMPLPSDFCQNALQQFKEEGYMNEWIQAEKCWKRLSIRSVVLAKLTMTKFVLYQYIYREGELILENQIAESITREALFYEYLGGLFIDKLGNLIYRQKNKVISTFNLNTNKFVCYS